MSFAFSAKAPTASGRFLQRAFEILPGLTSWTILIGMTWLSFKDPLAAAVAIIAFDLYWLLRIFYTTIFLVLASIRLRAERRTDWMARVKEIDELESRRPEEAPPSGPYERLSRSSHAKLVKILKKSGEARPRSRDVHHLVIFPVAKETRAVVEPGIVSVIRQNFPLKNVLVVLALEARAPEASKRGAYELKETYGSFVAIEVVEHPDGVPGEARVKGANATYAARWAAEEFVRRHVSFENVVVSCFDSDTVLSPDYFACLTYHFLVTPDRLRASFQPIPVYHNNLWDAPGFARIMEMGSSFFQLMEATLPDKLVTFSSHSMSFKALVDCGYWPVDMISDDSAIFWKAYLAFDGRYRVVPMYVTLSMDVVAADGWRKTAVAVYRQKRRWAWGVENFPIVMRGFLGNGKIPLSDKLKHGIKLFEGHVAWATWAFILTFVGWLPGLFAGSEFSSSVLYYSAPRITGIIFNLALFSLLTTIVLSLYLLPEKPMRHPILKRMAFAVEWLLVPFIATFLSALPALDTQTRFLFARYMEFRVTEKKR